MGAKKEINRRSRQNPQGREENKMTDKWGNTRKRVFDMVPGNWMWWVGGINTQRSKKWLRWKWVEMMEALEERQTGRQRDAGSCCKEVIAKPFPLTVIAQLMERDVLNTVFWRCGLLTAPWKMTAASKQSSTVDLWLIWAREWIVPWMLLLGGAFKSFRACIPLLFLLTHRHTTWRAELNLLTEFWQGNHAQRFATPAPTTLPWLLNRDR